MKKNWLVIIALAVIGMTAIAPPIPAQSAADVREMQEITADFQAGKITLPEFQRRIEAVQNRMGQGAYDEPPPAPQPRQQAQPQQAAQVIRKTAAGTTPGWPAASAFRRYGFTIPQINLGNPNGITPSYKIQGETLTIYIAKNFSAEMTQASILEAGMSDADRDALKRHIARAAGLNANQASELMAVPDPSRRNTGAAHYNIQITIQFDSLTEDVLTGVSYRTVKWTVIEIEPYTQNTSGN